MAATGMPPSCRRRFEGKRLIQRHQRVYATLGAKMHTDEVHALSMKTYTPAEWAATQLTH
jgi:acid stress-induced BolA-like protein IbaG/YrbA